MRPRRLAVAGPLAFYEVNTGGEPDGTTLVLGHALGSSHEMWLSTIEYLRPGVRVLLWEQPGHGESALLETSILDTGSEVPDLRLVARSLHHELSELHAGTSNRLVIAGLSLGGMVSLALAQDYPEFMDAVVMMSSAAVLLPHEAWFERAALVNEQGQSSLAEPTMQRWFTPEFAAGIGKTAVQRTLEIFTSTSREGYAQCCSLIEATDLRDGIDQVRRPVTIIVGEDDPGVNLKHIAALTAGLDAGEQIVLPNARHMLAVEFPQLIAEYLNRACAVD